MIINSQRAVTSQLPSERRKMEEIWKDIEGFNGRFAVSNKGRVLSKARYINRPYGKTFKEDYILKPHKNHKGYLAVDLDKKKNKVIHRLVALAFIPNPENKPQVNHIDGDKTNNNVENLEWCTNQENQIHAVRMGLNDHSKYESGKPKKPVVQIDIKTGKIVGRYNSIKEAANAVGQKTSSNIGGVCRGSYGRKTIGGYYWKFESEVM